nr:selenoneine synthase SenA [uncultured Roseateles sp.]
MSVHRPTGEALRRAAPESLAEALRQSRADTLAIAALFEQGPEVPRRAGLNPPRWELGHIGWFQEFWIARHPQRHLGPRADPQAPRLPALRGNADALYDSSQVPHASRWSLPLPDAAATRDDLHQQLQGTLALLTHTETADDALYFFRLALLHEDMHHEAGLYMAQALDMGVSDPRWQPRALPQPRQPLRLDAAIHRLGDAGPGFAFDNELAAHDQPLTAFEIDSRVVSWAEFLPFVEAGGYGQPHWWSGPGRRWLSEQAPAAPRYLRRAGKDWEQRLWGRWRPLDPALPACHLNAHEAQAWCAWAGRRLPTEAEWERAALAPSDPAFAWGSVWEWTASAFAPYPGFRPHPYQDYSAPWFDGRPVLRGASFGTQPRLHHPRYRNFFTAERNDIFAGFRSCAR